MGAISKILNRVNVLVTVYDNTGEYALSLWQCCKSGKAIEIGEAAEAGDPSKIKSVPAIILAGGYGVISKNIENSGDIVQQVVADPEKFMWSYSGGGERLIFVKREQLAGALENIVGKGFKTVAASCFDIRTKETEAAVADAAEEYYSRMATLRNVCRPGAAGSAMAQMLFHKLKMPVLVAVLLILVANALIGPRIGTKLAAQRQEVAALERSFGKQSESDRNRQRVLSEFGVKLPDRYAVICDKAGSAVPGNVVLTQLAVQPLTKAMEQGRKPLFAERSVVIRGEAAGPDDVSTFARSLGETGSFREIHLTSIDKDRESGKTIFRIDAGL